MRKYRNRILAGMAVVFAIYVALLLFVNTEELLANLRVYPWTLFIPVVLLKLVAWVLRFGQWQYYLGVIGARDKISVFDSVVLFLAGFTMAVSPGKIAEVLKAVILKVKTGIPVARSAPVVIAERVVDGVAVVVVVFLLTLLAGDDIQLGAYSILIAISGVLLTIGLIAVQVRPLAYFLLDICGKLHLVKRIHRPLVEFYESSREVLSIRHVFPTMLMGSAAHLVDSLGFAIVLTGFGVELTWILFLQVTVIIGLSAAVGALSGLPNGAGVTEVSTSATLLAIVAPQNPEITQSIAVTAALIEGIFHKWIRVLTGMVVAIIFRRRLFPPSLELAIEEMETERAQKRAAYTMEGSQV
jgi:glycosyltransferase 2 family protein